MGVLSTVKELFEASTQNPNRGGGSEQSKGAYWCHDCNERILDLHVAEEGTPDCPECGTAMEFERSVASTGCAC